MSAEEKRILLRALWRDKMHVEPRALDLAPPSIRTRFEHILAPAEKAVQMLEALPVGWLAIWEQSARGHLVFTHRASAYLPGAQPWRDGTLESVCYIGVADLIDRADRCEQPAALIPILYLLDHLFGSDARPGGPRLSDGAGTKELLEQVGRRFQRIHALAYGHAELQVVSAQDYFAHTVCQYLANPRELGVLDPLVHRLYAQTLFDQGFWERVRPRQD